MSIFPADPEPPDSSSLVSVAPAATDGTASCGIDLTAACDGTMLHSATGHVVVRLSGCKLGDAGIRRWISTCMLPRIEVFREAGHVIRQADFDISHNQLSDSGFGAFMKAWCKIGASCPLVVKAHCNNLTDISLKTLASFVSMYRGQVRELHLSHNDFDSHSGILQLLASFAGQTQYPMWVRRQRRYAPVYLRLDHCGIADPGELLSKSPQRLCLMPKCSKTLCCETSGDRTNSGSCPIAHLYGFLDQDNRMADSSRTDAMAECDGTQDECPHIYETHHPEPGSKSGGSLESILIEPAVAASSAEELPHGDHHSYLCGSCGRDLPINMFGRHQFRKAAQVDSDPGLAHLTRRCNDCVTQPCCACGLQLPLSKFAKGQLMRPHELRRCRSCCVDTILCARCNLPKPKSSFSVREAHKRKVLPRVCSDCEQINPYFERRHAVALIFGCCRSSMRISQSTLPGLPQEIVQRVVALSEPGDEFTKVSPRSFSCSLCVREWSLATNDMERHIRSGTHLQRLKKLREGSLVLIDSLDIERSRFCDGLGIRGAVCSRERIKEAEALVRVSDARAQGLTLEVLQVAGLPLECPWVAPRILDIALGLQLGSAAPPEGTNQSAEVRSAQRRWKLFGHLSGEMEGFDADELSAVSAILSSD